MILSHWEASRLLLVPTTKQWPFGWGNLVLVWWGKGYHSSPLWFTLREEIRISCRCILVVGIFLLFNNRTTQSFLKVGYHCCTLCSLCVAGNGIQRDIIGMRRSSADLGWGKSCSTAYVADKIPMDSWELHQCFKRRIVYINLYISFIGENHSLVTVCDLRSGTVFWSQSSLLNIY